MENKVVNDDIELLDIQKLRKKKIIQRVRKTVVGLIIGTTVITYLPTLNFNVNLFFAQNDSSITSVVNDDNMSMRDKARYLFELGMDKNSRVSDDLKETIITSFENYVIDEYSDYFTEKYLYNMYTSAKTVKVKEMSDYAKEHGWWSGSYNPSFNEYSVLGKEDYLIVAHEQLHASLKKGRMGYGLTTGIKGYAVNEGLTISHVSKDGGYYDEMMIANYIGLIIGKDKINNAYFNCDLNSIKVELEKYLEPSEVEQLIKSSDIVTLGDYFDTFLYRNDLLKIIDRDRISNIILENNKKVMELIRKAYENKYNTMVDSNGYGRVLFGKGSYYEKCMLYNGINIEEPTYSILDVGPDNYMIRLYYHCNRKFYHQDILVSNEELKNFDIDKEINGIKEEALNDMKNNVAHSSNVRR